MGGLEGPTHQVWERRLLKTAAEGAGRLHLAVAAEVPLRLEVAAEAPYRREVAVEAPFRLALAEEVPTRLEASAEVHRRTRRTERGRLPCHRVRVKVRGAGAEQHLLPVGRGRAKLGRGHSQRTSDR
jgi:hypothetical protein